MYVCMYVCMYVYSLFRILVFTEAIYKFRAQIYWAKAIEGFVDSIVDPQNVFKLSLGI